MNENKMYACAFCGKLYKNVEERMKCENKCLAEFKKSEKVKAENERKVKYQESQRAINKALKDVDEMITKHFDEYNDLEFDQDYPYLFTLLDLARWVM